MKTKWSLSSLVRHKLSVRKEPVLTKTPRTTHYYGIQYLRGISAIFVVLAHVGGMVVTDRFYHGVAVHALVYGRIGVDIFFVISGFIITTICLERDTLKVRTSIVGFTKRRVARIIPFMWSVVALYAAIRYLGTGAFEVMPYLRALSLWPVGELRPNVIWTLRHEFLFYTIFAISLLCSRKIVGILYAWCLIPMMAATLADFGVIELETFRTNWPYLAFLFNNINAEFGCGIIVGILSLRGKSFDLHGYGGLLVIALAITEFALIAIFDLGLGHTIGVVAICSMSTILVFTASSVTKENGWLPRLLEILGDASYSIYLLHGLITMVVVNAAVRILPDANAVFVQFFCVLLAISGGALVHFILEKPIVGYARKVLR